jgi:hypothetical protein
MESTKCPLCFGEIHEQAQKCRHCGEWINRQRSHESAQDDRETCGSCGKKMIPRIITGPPLVHGQGSWTPVPKKSICPYCGNTHKEFPPSPGEKIGSVIFTVVFVTFALYIIKEVFF